MLKALIFDFDGLILDTETPLLMSWREVFHRCEVPIDDRLLARLVEPTREPAEAYRLLEAGLGTPVDRERLRTAREAREAEMISALGPRPGLERLLETAKEQGLRTAIASNSRMDWIGPHLFRLGLASAFDTIRCRDHVARVKPDPELYLAVLTDLGLEAGEAVALEDAPSGASAARLAGVACVAVPNPATVDLDWGRADLTVPSLEAVTLDELRALVARDRSGFRQPPHAGNSAG